MVALPFLTLFLRISFQLARRPYRLGDHLILAFSSWALCWDSVKRFLPF